MTRPRRTKPAPAQPLPERIRAAIAADWTSLTTLDTLTGARGSEARRAVHEALGALRGEGAVLEERVTAAGVEVRLLTLPAPQPDDGMGVEDTEPMTIEEAVAIVSVEIERAKREAPPIAYNIDCPKCGEIHLSNGCPRADAPASHGELDAAPVAVEPSAPAEAAQGPAAPEREPTDPHFVECPVCRADPGHPCKGPGAPHTARAADAEAWARVQDGLAAAPAPAPKEPGPSSRCAVCSAVYRGHAPADSHAFAPKPRGRPRAPAMPPVAPIPNAAPAILPRRKASKTRGPVVDVDGGRVERAAAPAADDVLAELGTPRAWAAGAGAEPETSRGESDPSAKAEAEARAKRYRFWSPSHGLGWLTWGEVLPSTPTRFEADSGATFEWIWVECGTGRPGKKEPRGDGAARKEWDEWQWFRTTGAEVLTFRRGGAPQGAEAPSAEARALYEAIKAAGNVVCTLPNGSTPNAPRPVERCRPPACHADDIHEPSRVRGFARPLCERHRRWVEGAGGSVASDADAAALAAG